MITSLFRFEIIIRVMLVVAVILPFGVRAEISDVKCSAFAKFATKDGMTSMQNDGALYSMTYDNHNNTFEMVEPYSRHRLLQEKEVTDKTGVRVLVFGSQSGLFGFIVWPKSEAGDFDANIVFPRDGYGHSIRCMMQPRKGF